MTDPIEFFFFVPGVPIAQPRARAFNRGKHAGVYDPGTAAGWKALVALFAKPHIPPTPLTGPVRVDIGFVFLRPKYMLAKKYPDGRIYHNRRPDRDNLEKAVLDALTQVGMWQDDCQVCDGGVYKIYAARNDDPPGAYIQIQPLKPSGDSS